MFISIGIEVMFESAPTNFLIPENLHFWVSFDKAGTDSDINVISFRITFHLVNTFRIKVAQHEKLYRQNRSNFTPFFPIEQSRVREITTRVLLLS